MAQPPRPHHPREGWCKLCPPPSKKEKVLLRAALSVCFFGNRVGRTVICHETTKGRFFL